MKKYLRFGSFSNNAICMGILITSFIILYRLLYFGTYVADSNIKVFILNMRIFYVKFLEPIVVLIWLKFICEFLFKCLKRD